ncbi:MAG: ATP-binding cassette domain-containing protein [Phycisphaerae bacterium]
MNARIRRPAPRRASARRLAELFGLRDGTWETLYRNFELTVEPGQIVAVIGPSGAGKSVLLRQVLARLDATALATADLARSDSPAIDAVGDGPLAERLEVLSRCGLAEAAVLVTPARCLSAGQVHRLALARALWRARRGGAGLIVADEFAANLDDDTTAALAVGVRKQVRAQGVGLLAATPHANILEHLQPDKVIVKPLGRPAWIVTPDWSRRGGTGNAASGWPIRAGTIRDYRALADFHYLAGPPAAHKRVYVIRRPRLSLRRRGGWASAAAPDVAAVLVISPPLISVATRDVSAAGRYAVAACRKGLVRLNEEVECISRVIVHPTYRSCGLAVRLVRHALRTSPAAVVEALAVMGRVHPFFELAGMMSWYVGGAGKYVYYDHVDAARSVRNGPPRRRRRRKIRV